MKLENMTGQQPHEPVRSGAILQTATRVKPTKTMRKVSSPVLLIAALWPALVSGQVTNPIAASANAYVLRSSASADQAESQALGTKRLNDSNTRIAYVRFNLASFLGQYPVANITSARLRLYYTGGAS